MRDERVETRGVNAAYAGKICACAFKLPFRGVQKAHAQRAHCPHATVVGSATPNGNRYLCGTVTQCVEHELTRSIGTGKQGVSLCVREQREPGGCRHLNDGTVAWQHAVGCLDGSAKWI